MRFKSFITFINENNNFSEFKFEEDAYGYHDNQVDIRVKMFKDNVLLAFVEMAKYEGKYYIQYIESKVKGKGYGTILMRYLASLYGYENLERTSLTPDGVKMRAKLDKEFNYDYAEAHNKHLKVDVLNNIKDKEIRTFLQDLVHIGYSEAWKKLIDIHGINIDKHFKHDMNDVAEIAEWIRGSKTNDNYEETEPPHFITELLEELSK